MDTVKQPTAQQQLTADLSLVAIVLIWGATFTLVKDAVAVTQPLLFLSLRFGFAAVGLAVLLTVRRAFTPLPLREGLGEGGWRRVELTGGLLIGLAYWAGHALQSIGLKYTTAANAGFITGLSVVLVPFFAYALLRHKPGLWPVVGVGLAAVGLALLSIADNFTVNPGDWLQIASAVCFAGQIVLVSRYARGADPLRLSLVIMATAAALSLPTSAIFEYPVAQGWLLPGNILLTAAFMGLVASAVAQLVQNVAQRSTSPVHAALIFTLEPVAAATFAYFFAAESLTGRQLIGCGLILSGMLLAELGPRMVGVVRKLRVEEQEAA